MMIKIINNCPNHLQDTVFSDINHLVGKVFKGFNYEKSNGEISIYDNKNELVINKNEYEFVNL